MKYIKQSHNYNTKNFENITKILKKSSVQETLAHSKEGQNEF